VARKETGKDRGGAGELWATEKGKGKKKVDHTGYVFYRLGARAATSARAPRSARRGGRKKRKNAAVIGRQAAGEKGRILFRPCLAGTGGRGGGGERGAVIGFTAYPGGFLPTRGKGKKERGGAYITFVLMFVREERGDHRSVLSEEGGGEKKKEKRGERGAPDALCFSYYPAAFEVLH